MIGVTKHKRQKKNMSRKRNCEREQFIASHFQTTISKTGMLIGQFLCFVYITSFVNTDYTAMNRLIGLVGRVFANGPGDLVSILGLVISKTLKMVLDSSLINTQQYKVRIKGKVEQSRKRSSALPYTPVVVAIEKGAFWLPTLFFTCTAMNIKKYEGHKSNNISWCISQYCTS